MARRCFRLSSLHSKNKWGRCQTQYMRRNRFNARSLSLHRKQLLSHFNVFIDICLGYYGSKLIRHVFPQNLRLYFVAPDCSFFFRILFGQSADVAVRFQIFLTSHLQYQCLYVHIQASDQDARIKNVKVAMHRESFYQVIFAKNDFGCRLFHQLRQGDHSIRISVPKKLLPSTSNPNPQARKRIKN